MQGKNRGIASIFTILILLGVGILTFLVLYRSNLKTKEPSQYVTNEKTQVPREVPNEITSEDLDVPSTAACSNVYTNEKYKFSVDCPTNWSVTLYESDKEYKQDGTIPYFNESDVAHVKFVSADNTTWFEIHISNNDTENVETNNKEETSPEYSGAPSSVKQEPDVIIAGISSDKFTSTGTGSVTVSITTRTPDRTYNFIMDDKYWDESEKTKADEVYEKFLTSFTLL
ncbi:hypothetical protein OAL67_00900 [bacterium]|nr:hypothetical protein [bacterium]